MWARSPPQTHHSRRTILEAKPKLNLAAWFSIKGTLKMGTFLLYCLILGFSSPKGRENNFHRECPDPKMWSSNSGRDEKENCHTYNWEENQYPGWWINQFQKIPNRGKLIWISGEPILREIIEPWSTERDFSSCLVAIVVSWSDNVGLIPRNLIINWLNHHFQQYSLS